MARGRNVENLDTLRMALIGYEHEKEKIETKIRELRAELKGKGIASPSQSAPKAPGTRRNLSAAARARIAAAQRKRWAEHRKRAASAAKAK